MRILRETAHDVAVIKPMGMATEMRCDPLRESLLSKLSSLFPERRVRLPHRLDRVTRGIVLAALSDEAVRYYNREIREGRWDKYYLGRVRNPQRLDERSLLGRHKAYLSQKGGRAVIVRSGGDPAILDILAISPSPGSPAERHVLVRLLTGRYHQIRVMLEGLGIPLVGDPIYAGKPSSDRETFYLEHIALRYRDFSSGEVRFLHLENDPEREPVSDALGKQLFAILHS